MARLERLLYRAGVAAMISHGASQPRGRIRTVVGGVVAAGMVATILCTCGGGSPPPGHGPPGAKDIAIKAQDANGLLRCSQSGQVDSVAAAIRRNGNDASADRLATSWQDAKTTGASDAYVSGLANSESQCAQYVFGSGDVSPRCAGISFSAT